MNPSQFCIVLSPTLFYLCQIRRIAKKYKTQFEELTKTAEEERAARQQAAGAQEQAQQEQTQQQAEQTARLTEAEARAAAADARANRAETRATEGERRANEGDANNARLISDLEHVRAGFSDMQTQVIIRNIVRY